jgi:uncharacterized membrane protein
MGKTDRVIVGGLIALSLIPVLAGIARLHQVASGDAASPDDARFLAAPAAVILHIVAVTPYCLLGALQFAPGFRRSHPRWHRRVGVILVGFGLVAALTGLWMSEFYPRIATDSLALRGVRFLVGWSMVAAILLAVAALRRRDFKAHGAWMLRAYALGQGAGTQVLTHLPWFIFVGLPGPVSRAALMTAGWLINIAVVEWLLRRAR